MRTAVAFAFLLWAIPAFCAGQVPNYRLTIPRITPPRIDGDVTDLAWTECSLKNGKIVIDLDNAANFRVDLPRIAYLGYSSQALYVCVINFTPDPKKLVSAKPQTFWFGDDVELYIQPAGFTEAEFVQIGITPDGGVGQLCHDGRNRDATEVKTASVRADNRWCLEVAIPFSYLGVPPPKPGDAWRFNIAGKQTTGGWLSWNPTYGSFTSPDRFATIVFGR